SAALRVFCLLKPKPKAISVRTPVAVSLPPRTSCLGRFSDGFPPRDRAYSTGVGLVSRTRAIVRRPRKNRMVTKGYRKGVYDRVTLGTARSRSTPLKYQSLAHVLTATLHRELSRPQSKWK